MNKKYLYIIIALFLKQTMASQTQIGQDIVGESFGEYSGWSISMPDEKTIAIGAPYNSLYTGQVRVYTFNGIFWSKKGQNFEGEQAYDKLGYSVSMPDSNTIAIGAPFNESYGFDGGQVRIYIWDGTDWTQKGQAFYGNNGFELGTYVYMPDSNTIAIGAPGFTSNYMYQRGKVMVFSWNGNAWMQKGQDLLGEMGYDRYGVVEMPDSNTIAIGSPNTDSQYGYGHVKVYSWDNTGWVQKGSTIYGLSQYDNFGWSVSMPDAYNIAIGCPYYYSIGTFVSYAQVFKWINNDWVQQGNTFYPDSLDNQLGWSISMPDAYNVAIGSPSNFNNNNGELGIYYWDGLNWVQNGQMIYGFNYLENFGTSLSMASANYFAVGALGDSIPGNASGTVRVYKICTSYFIDPVISCGDYTWIDSITYTSSNYTAKDTLINILGCDSIVTLNFTMANPDFIIIQPSEITLFEGENAMFTVNASNVDYYQWQSDIGNGFENLNNGGQYVGIDSSILTINNVTLFNDNQLFRCLVSNSL